MPGMNGVELAISISKMFPAARIMLFSGQAGISDILMEGYRQGFEFELIAKPIHPLKLIEHLKNQSS
jgi:CheY-like chemotaxis protein